MFKKFLKNQKGTALVFVMILIANALAIVSSIVFILVIQEKATAKMKLTPAAYQKADSGLEYLLREINHEWTLTDYIDELCDSFNNKKCTINSPIEFTAYFFDDADNFLDGGDIIGDINKIKVIGQVDDGGSNSVSRSLQTLLFQSPSP